MVPQELKYTKCVNKLLCGYLAILIVLLNYTVVIAAPNIHTGEFIIDQEKILEQLINQSEHYWPTNKAKSDSVIEIAFQLISKNKTFNNKLLGDAYHVYGKVLVNRNNQIAGIDTLKAAMKYKINSDKVDYVSLAKTYNYLGIGFLGLLELDSAIFYCNKSIEQLINNNIYDINLYYAYLNIGISYSRMGKYSNAIAYFDKALIALNHSKQANDSLMIAGFYYNYALVKTLTGKLKEANGYFEKAETIFCDYYGDSHIHIAGINNNKGINSYYDYDFLKAELYYKKALDIYIINNADGDKIALAYYNLSQISQESNNYSESIRYCLLGLEHSSGNDLSLLLNKSIAQSYAAIEDDKKANYYFKISLNLLKRGNINPRRKQELYSSYADFLLKTNNKLSLNYYKKALTSAANLNGTDSDKYAQILTQIGYYFTDFIINSDSAMYYFKNSISIFDTINTKTELANIYAVQKINAQVGYASALINKFNNTNHVSLLLEADSIFANVLNKMQEVSNSLGNNDKLVLIEMSNPIYNKAIKNSTLLFNITEKPYYANKIFNYTERSKSAALLSAVNSEHALKTSDIPIDLFQLEHQLKDEINGLRQLLENERIEDSPNELKVNFFESKLLLLTNKHDSLIVSIETNYPKYYSVKYGTEVISPTEIKHNLANDEAIIEYQLTETVLYIVVITKSEFSIIDVPIDTNFYNSLNYIITIKNTDLSDQNFEIFNEFKYHSNNLWKILIEPSTNMLNNKRLIIIPDGILGYLPFDILLEKNMKIDSINYRDLPYLIKKHPLSYSYSATLRYNNYFDLDREKPEKNIIAFAPIYGVDTASKNVNQLEPLPFAKHEAREIIKNQGGVLYSDDSATKNNFISQAGSSNILHLAMHTIINDSLPMQSKLVFYDDDTSSFSHFMFTHEIYNMNLNASMIVLSACNTGAGNIKRGEGIMSLARGFVYAGVPSIVMTLWEVQDVSGSEIMNSYYNYLNQDISKDIALQNAKLDMLQNANMAKSHPFFWSTYIISGDTSSIETAKQKFNYYWAISILVVLLLMFSYISLKKNTNRIPK